MIKNTLWAPAILAGLLSAACAQAQERWQGAYGGLSFTASRTDSVAPCRPLPVDKPQKV